MAIKKSCDNCDKILNRDKKPFLQLHGSISEQIEDGISIMFRYLTAHYQHKLAFCDDSCLIEWINKQRALKAFVVPEGEGPVIHT